MFYAISIPPFTRPTDIVRLAVAADEAGWDGVFLWDHLHFVRDLRLDVHDPWVLLGAIAVSTERVRLGTMVTPLARRRPWVVAKHLVTLDHLSGGRAVLGVGLGEPPDDDFGAFGDPVDPVERAALLDESLAVVDGLVRGRPVHHEGAHHRIDAELLPAALQEPRPPVWVAGIWPHRRPLARSLRWDGFVPIGPNAFLEPEQVTQVRQALGDVPDGFDLVISAAPGAPASAYEDAGATWLVSSRWPMGDWYDDLLADVRAGPTR